MVKNKCMKINVIVKNKCHCFFSTIESKHLLIDLHFTNVVVVSWLKSIKLAMKFIDKFPLSHRYIAPC